MKKALYIVNAVLIIAVGGLYYLHFSASGVAESTLERAVEEGEFATLEESIVYVNFDTLLNNYDMFYDYERKLMERQQELENELNAKSREYERQVSNYQDQVQKGLVTRSQAQEMELELMQKQQELMQLQEEYRQELREEEQVMNRQIHHSIYEYLEEYNKDKGYQFILSQTFGGAVLYSKKDLDVTYDIINGLNEKYSRNR